MIADPNFDLLLVQLFDVAATSDWSNWLASARRFFGAAAAILAPISTSASAWQGGITDGVATERLDAYRNHFHRVDNWTNRVKAVPAGAPQSMQMLVPDDELLRSEIYNDYMKPVGRRYALGMTLDVGPSRFLFALGRSKDEGDFTGDHFAAMERMGVFMRRALATQRLLQASEVSALASQAVMNQSRRGVMLLDASLRVVFQNRVASEMLALGDIIGLRTNQLVAINRNDERRFRDALETVATRVGEQRILPLHGVRTDSKVTVSVVGISPSQAPMIDLGVVRPAILMIVNDNANLPEVKPEHLESAFGFTVQEARTASLLLAGLELTEVAERLSISKETVRYHLKSLFAKTGTHSQRELVHYITVSLPPLTASVPRSIPGAPETLART
ncbi:MAG: helix-turn-helix transcriptional regulator [Bauldia sp.]